MTSGGELRSEMRLLSILSLCLVLQKTHESSGLRDGCEEMVSKYAIQPGISWGALPQQLRRKWKDDDCDAHYHVLGEANFHGSQHSKVEFSRIDDGSLYKCKILLFDNIKGYLNWNQKWFVKAVLHKCKQPCTITDDKKQGSDANVIIFHAPTHKKIMTPPRGTKRNSLKILVSLEQGEYAPLLMDHSYLKSNFDATMTYSMNKSYASTGIDNVPLTYFPLELFSPQDILKPEVSFRQKTGFDSNVSLVAMISNCHNGGATSRTEYLLELEKHFPTHFYGKCLNNRQLPKTPPDPSLPPTQQRKAQKLFVFKHYKFCIAFENLQEEDYVTEKVFEALLAGCVPVYRGSATIENFMPSSDSFINANNLSPIQLANKLMYLSQSESDYHKFFHFKNRTGESNILRSFSRMALKSYTHPNVLCRIGTYVNRKFKMSKNY